MIKYSTTFPFRSLKNLTFAAINGPIKNVYCRFHSFCSFSHAIISFTCQLTFTFSHSLSCQYFILFGIQFLKFAKDYLYATILTFSRVSTVFKNHPLFLTRLVQYNMIVYHVHTIFSI